MTRRFSGLSRRRQYVSCMADVLMLNQSEDELFSPEDTHALYNAIRGRTTRLRFGVVAMTPGPMS